jgi:hypothetical protein
MGLLTRASQRYFCQKLLSKASSRRSGAPLKDCTVMIHRFPELKALAAYELRPAGRKSLCTCRLAQRVLEMPS